MKSASRLLRSSLPYVPSVLTGVILLGILPFLDNSGIFVVINIVVFALAAVGLSLMFGRVPRGGHPMIMSFGQSAFITAGAYLSTLAMQWWGINFFAAMLFAVVCSIAAAVIIGMPAANLGPLGFGLVTFVLAFVVSIFLFGDALLTHTRGVLGLVPKGATFFGIEFRESSDLYTLATVFLVIGMIAAVNIARSRLGSELRLVSRSEPAAAACGIGVVRVKVTMFAIGAVYATISGALLAQSLGHVSPDSAAPFRSLELVAMVLVGGSGSIFGPVVGSAIVYGAPELIDFGGEALRMYVAALVLVTLVAAPNGLVGLGQALLQRIRRERGRVATPVVGRPEAVRHLSHAERDATVGQARGGPLMSVRGLSVAFGGVRAVDDLDLDICAGTIHALIGPNGAGKTTLLNAVCRFVDVDSGTIRVGDVDITHRRPNTLLGLGIARGFQHPQLVEEMTVLENVMFSEHAMFPTTLFGDLVRSPRARQNIRAREERGMEALSRVGLESVAQLRASDLSYGVRKLVDVARVVSSSPRLALLDEPTSGLDEPQIAHLSACLRELQATITILVVAHDLQFVTDLADIVTVLDSGRKLVEGPATIVRSDARVVEVYTGARA